MELKVTSNRGGNGGGRLAPIATAHSSLPVKQFNNNLFSGLIYFLFPISFLPFSNFNYFYFPVSIYLHSRIPIFRTFRVLACLHPVVGSLFCFIFRFPLLSPFISGLYIFQVLITFSLYFFVSVYRHLKIRPSRCSYHLIPLLSLYRSVFFPVRAFSSLVCCRLFINASATDSCSYPESRWTRHFVGNSSAVVSLRSSPFSPFPLALLKHRTRGVEVQECNKDWTDVHGVPEGSRLHERGITRRTRK